MTENPTHPRGSSALNDTRVSVGSEMLVTLRASTELEISGFGEPAARIHADAGDFDGLRILATSLAVCSGDAVAEYSRWPLAIDTRNVRVRLR